MSFAPDRRPTDLAGRQVLVTGATAGIGRAISLSFAREGASVVGVGRRKERLAELEHEVKGLKAGAFRGVALDIRDEKGLAALAKKEPEMFSATDVLVNNAGLALGRDKVHEGKPEDWQVVFDTNVMALLRLTRLVVPHMVARGRGHVVNLGSTAGRWLYPGGAVYCASKHAVRAITEGLRLDLSGTGVRVTEVQPGLVETEFSIVRLGDAERAKRAYEGMTPLVAEDIADIVLWVCRQPAHVNVQELVVYPTDQASVRDVHRRPEA